MVELKDLEEVGGQIVDKAEESAGKAADAVKTGIFGKGWKPLAILGFMVGVIVVVWFFGGF